MTIIDFNDEKEKRQQKISDSEDSVYLEKHGDYNEWEHEEAMYLVSSLGSYFGDIVYSGSWGAMKMLDTIAENEGEIVESQISNIMYAVWDILEEYLSVENLYKVKDKSWAAETSSELADLKKIHFSLLYKIISYHNKVLERLRPLEA